MRCIQRHGIRTWCVAASRRIDNLLHVLALERVRRLLRMLRRLCRVRMRRLGPLPRLCTV